MQFASHQLHQLAANGQAQPSSLHAPALGIDLLKWSKNLIQLLRRNSWAGILNLKPYLALLAANFEDNAAFLGEFDSIAQ